MEGTPPLNARLAHLTPDRLAELIRRYYARTDTVPSLMEEFGIVGNSSHFVRMLPPVVHDDRVCRFCAGQKLISDRLARDRREVPEAYCPNCGHRDSPRCSCQTCTTAAWQKAKEIDQKKRAVLQQRFAVRQEPELEVDALTLKEAVCLLALLRHSVSEDLSTASPHADRREKLSPNTELRDYAIGMLQQHAFLAVSPDSPVDAFIFNDELTDCPRFYPAKATWLFMPGIDAGAKKSFIADLERVARDGPWPRDWHLDAFDLWLEIAKAECFEYYALQLSQRGFEAEFGDKTHTVFDNLLESFSIGQVFNLTWQAVRDMTDYIVKNRLTKRHAKNTFIGAIQRKADKHRTEGWTTKSSRRDFDCPQSIISSVFFDLFMGIGAKALETPPRANWTKAGEIEPEIPF